MKIKKSISYTNKNQIWRLLLSNSGIMVLQTMNKETKEVSFSCIDINNEKIVFEDYQFEEKNWIGIEEVKDDVIYFHNYLQPDLPIHNGIIAFSIEEKKVLWQNEELIYDSSDSEFVYGKIVTFDEQKIFKLEKLTGKIISEIPFDISTTKAENFSPNEYFPLNYSYTIPEEKVKNIIEKKIKKENIAGFVEYIIYEEFLLFNYHSVNKNGNMKNQFYIYEIEKNKKLYSDILNKSVKSFAPDSFYISNGKIILLKEKFTVEVLKIQ